MTVPQDVQAVVLAPDIAIAWSHGKIVVGAHLGRDGLGHVVQVVETFENRSIRSRDRRKFFIEVLLPAAIDYMESVRSTFPSVRFFVKRRAPRPFEFDPNELRENQS